MMQELDFQCVALKIKNNNKKNMAILIQSNNYSGQTASVTLYAPTGHTIPYNSPSGTTVNVGEQVLPFIYQNENPAMQYGVFSLFFSGANKTCETSLLTPPDGDGNQYRTIIIGNQIWMAENLRTTKFQDGSPIYYATSGGSWTTSASTTPLYTFVNNNSGNTEIHGLLYNYQAVRFSTSANTTTNLCPVGWRVPTSTDFLALPVFTGNSSSDGVWFQYPGNEYWDGEVIYEGGRTNKTGFNLLGSGGFNGTIWSNFKLNSYHKGTTSADIGYIGYAVGVSGYIGLIQPSGGSVRCIKN
jgi:uncharacterized protein (TIGR02145 family)